MKIYKSKDSYGKPGPFVLATTPMAAGRILTAEAPGFMLDGPADACLIGIPEPEPEKDAGKTPTDYAAKIAAAKAATASGIVTKEQAANG